MSLKDDLIVSYMSVYTEKSNEQIQQYEAGLAAGTINPMHAKLDLAESLVQRYHGPEAAAQERKFFIDTFSQKKSPDEVTTYSVRRDMDCYEAVRQIDAKRSKSEIRRLFTQNAVRIDGKPVKDFNVLAVVESGKTVQVGKRTFAKFAWEKN